MAIIFTSVFGTMNILPLIALLFCQKEKKELNLKNPVDENTHYYFFKNHWNDDEIKEAVQVLEKEIKEINSKNMVLER